MKLEIRSWLSRGPQPTTVTLTTSDPDLPPLFGTGGAAAHPESTEPKPRLFSAAFKSQRTRYEEPAKATVQPANKAVGLSAAPSARQRLLAVLRDREF